MRLLGDPVLPRGSLSLIHLSPKASPLPASPSCPIAAPMLGPGPEPWILLQGHPEGTGTTGEGERQSWREGLEEDWCWHCRHGNDRMGLRPHCREQLLQLLLDSRAFEGRQEAQVGVLRTQVGSQGDSQGEGGSGTCQINGLLEKTCPNPWIERWGNWVLRRKVVRTMFSKHIVGNWYFLLTSNDVSLFAAWLWFGRAGEHLGYGLGVRETWFQILAWPLTQWVVVLLFPLSLSFLIYQMDGVYDL